MAEKNGSLDFDYVLFPENDFTTRRKTDQCIFDEIW